MIVAASAATLPIPMAKVCLQGLETVSVSFNPLVGNDIERLE
jgi:hypothetical protein